MDMACQEEDVYKNPALFSALLKYIASERYGRIIEVFMPYGESLHSLSDWYVQLLSESLGKMSNTCLPYGRTPVPAVGTMDMIGIHHWLFQIYIVSTTNLMQLVIFLLAIF